VEVKGQAAMVTGGSRGLGAALGAELARRGARVVLVARGEEALRREVAAIRRAGGEAHALVADVGEKESVHPLAGAAAALVGPIDVLVQNASVLGPVPLEELAETPCEDFSRVLDVNLLGPFRLTKAVIGSMLLRGHGTIVGITSDAAVEAYPGWGAYGVSKAALEHLFRVWATELRHTGLRFLTVDPGEMDTAMHAEAMPAADRSGLATPRDVARRVVDLVEAADRHAGGARLTARLAESAA
jgi:NAD(P)-dependent dehydrogenase (short-subunit alcohol dehydrogenase family)